MRILRVSPKQRFYGILAVVVSLTLFIIACGDDSTPEPTPAAAPAAPAATVDVAAITSGLQRTIQEEVGKIQPPLSEAEIRGLIEGAISTSMPDSVSAAEIQSMVDSAVAAAAAEGVTQADVTAAIGEALAAAMAAAPEPLTASEIEQIVKASIPTPAPVAMATATPRPTATTPPALQPVVSRLKVAQVAPSTQSTMTHISSYAGSGPLRGLYEPLIGVDVDTGGYTPDRLATEWTLSSDGRDWTFKLREGVPFHNGVEFTAKDVVRTWEVYSAASSATTGASFFRNWLGDDKENFEIVNDHEIIWHLVKPEGGLRPWLSDLLMFLIISDDYWQEVGEEGYLEDPVGTGPFRFLELVFNSHILHERVDNHWRKTPEVEELQFFYVPEPANRQAMLLTEEAHIADLPRVLFPTVREQGMEIVHSTQAGSYILITYGGQYYDTPEGLEDVFDPTEPQLKLDVRKAMSLAINRQEINDVFFEGVLEPQTIHALHPREDPWVPGRWPPDPYDTAEAKRLLGVAGYPNGFDITLVVSPTSSVPELTDIAEIITNYWQDVGINAKLEVVESSYAVARERQLGGKAALGNTGLVSYELQMPLNLKLQKGQSHYHDKLELDALARKLETTIDPDGRIRAAQEIADYLYANYVTLPLFFVTTAVVVNPEVVEEYRAIILNIGPGFRHEYTKIVKR